MSKLYKLLYEKVNEKDIIDDCEGANGVIAVTSNLVYLVKGIALERKTIKTFSFKSITSIEIRKPGILTRGHFQIISSGSGDQTTRNSSVFDYAKDENTVMIGSDVYEHFLKIEQLIYQMRDKENNTPPILINQEEREDDAISKIEKLASLRDRNIISEEEFQEKKKALLSEI